MSRRPGRAALLAVLTFVVLGTLSGVASAGVDSAHRVAHTAAGLPAAHAAPGLPVAHAADGLPVAPIADAVIGGATYSQPMDPGYLGFSFEYSALHQYAGRNPDAINPMLLGLIKLLNPGQTPILRIGGNSTDDTWWPMPGVIPPGGVNYTLTPGWLRITHALATDLGAKLIMGINLEANRPALAATEARAIVQGVGASNIAALEIGNEPDLYSTFYWYGNRLHQAFFGRPPTYNLYDYVAQFSQWRKLMPAVPIAGPAFSALTWMTYLPDFLAAEPGLADVTFHRYALRACETDPQADDYASIPNLLLDRSSAGLAAEVAPFVAEAHRARIRFRLDELNSAACSGEPGVSNTFASSLWMLDTLFDMAAVGVDGVNVHTLPKSTYAPFVFKETGAGVWSAVVQPDYYGMLMFAQADPPGSLLLDVDATSGPLKVWAVHTPSGHTNVVLINKDPTSAYTVNFTLAGAQTPLTSVAMTAPSVSATSGVTIGGQSFPPGTTTPALSGTRSTGTVDSNGVGYTVTVPAASALMLTR